jgi:hypothetical protein
MQTIAFTARYVRYLVASLTTVTFATLIAAN